MFIYSVTIHIDKKNEAEWLQYMKEKHIAAVLSTGYFSKAVFRKIIVHNEEGVVSYNTEYLTETLEKYDEYVENAAPALQKEVLDRFAGKFTAERRLYEVLTELQ